MTCRICISQYSHALKISLTHLQKFIITCCIGDYNFHIGSQKHTEFNAEMSFEKGVWEHRGLTQQKQNLLPKILSITRQVFHTVIVMPNFKKCYSCSFILCTMGKFKMKKKIITSQHPPPLILFWHKAGKKCGVGIILGGIWMYWLLLSSSISGLQCTHTVYFCHGVRLKWDSKSRRMRNENGHNRNSSKSQREIAKSLTGITTILYVKEVSSHSYK